MSKSPEPKKLTKKAIVRNERQRKENRRMLIGAGIIAALIVAVLLYGVLDQTVLQARKPVAKVNGEAIRTDEFVKRVKLQRMTRNSMATQYYQFGQLYGADFSQYIYQIQLEMMNTVQFGNDVLDQMISEIVIADYAAEKGFVATDEAVQKELETQFGYDSEAESADTAAEETEADPEVPTPTPYTEELFKENLQSVLDQYKEIGVSEKDLRDGIRNQLLYEQVLEDVTADVVTTSEQVWAYHILVETEEEAFDVLARLDAGEEWADIAAEVSMDTSNKDNSGDLSWFGRGVMDTAFEEAAFALEVGEISEPVNSAFGWHIIQSLGKEDRPMEQSQIDQAKQTMFGEWLTAQKENYTIEKFDEQIEAASPSEPAFDERLLQ